MILCDKSLTRFAKYWMKGVDEDNIQPNSIDLCLDGNKGCITPPLLSNTRCDKFEELIIPPNELVLVSTKELICVPSTHCCRVEGKSSLGRIGLLTHITAGFIDSGFKGNITLELYNVGKYPIRLHNGCKIAQLVVEKLDDAVDNLYSGNYFGQDKVTPSIHEHNFDGSTYEVW